MPPPLCGGPCSGYLTMRRAHDPSSRSAGCSPRFDSPRRPRRPRNCWTEHGPYPPKKRKPASESPGRPPGRPAGQLADERLLLDGVHRRFLGPARGKAEGPRSSRTAASRRSCSRNVRGWRRASGPSGQTMSSGDRPGRGSHGHLAAGLRVERPQRGRVRDDPAGLARGRAWCRRRSGSRSSDRSRTTRRSPRSGRRSRSPSRRS